MADLSNVVRMLIHQLDATRSYLLPSYCDEDEKARAVIAFAESALAAEPPAPAEPVATLHVSDFRGYENYDFQHLVDLPPGHYKLFTACTAQPPESAEPDTDAVLALAAIIREVDGSHSLGAAALAEAILSHPGVAFSVLPPAPAPADHVPGARNMVPADEKRKEREELAQWLDHKGRGAWPCPDGFSAEAEAEEYEMFSGLTRAAALLREARPQPVPVPVAERPWERPGWCDAEGRCWWFNRVGIPQWQLADGGPYGDFCLPHWAVPIPQPPQGGEVES